MILLDTNIFIEIYRGNQEMIQTVSSIGQQNIAVSHVTCAELFFGARNKKELFAIKKDMSKILNLPIQEDISNLAVDLVAEYSLSHKLALPDALIAATAINHKLELYTLNVKDFRFLEEVKLFVK
jgi:tRNA(fMet)-specific endonuclease VapC